MLKDQFDQIAVTVGKAATLSGGTTAGAYLFGFTVSELAAFGGFVVAIIGACIQWYYNRRKDRRDHAQEMRDAEYHAARLASLSRLRDDDE